MFERWFQLSAHRTTVRTEVLAGATTFFTLAYILLVQPAVLSRDFLGQPTGMDPGGVLLATCVASAMATFLMGWWANYPIALAPGMGMNFFFVSIVMMLAGRGVTEAWQTALGMVFVAGLLFVMLTICGARQALVDVLSPSLRAGIAGGIGLLIAFLGLKNATLIVAAPGTLVAINPAGLRSVEVLVFLTGFVVTLGLQQWKIPGSILIGMLAAGVVAGLNQKLTLPDGWWVSLPDVQSSVAFQMNLSEAIQWTCWPYILILLFMDVFDTTGTLLAIGEQGNFLKGQELPRAREAMLADSIGTVIGALLGTSTITSYIESAAGVEQGGRTGLASVVTALLLLVALIFSPLLQTVGTYLPLTAAALVFVGAMMAQHIKNIDWQDLSESVPAFLILLGIPLTFSIAHGLALGLIAYPVLKLCGGKARQVSWLTYGLAILLIVYFVLLQGQSR